VLLGSNTLDLGLDNTSTTFSGAISGNGTLVKDGAGTFTLAGEDTYTGGTFVDDGTLVLASDTALAAGTSLTVGAGAASLFDASPAASFEVAAAPAGAAAVPEPGILALLGAAGIVAAAWWMRKKARRLARGMDWPAQK
jgi:autotransporter-associated beta strand protein